MKNKGKVIIGFFTILAALLFAFVVFPLTTGMVGNTTKIVRVKATVHAGDALTQENLEEIDVSQYNLPSDVVKNINDVVGKYTTARLEPGDYILSSKLVGDLVSSGNYLNALNGDKQIVSISIKDLASGVSGKLNSGDIVSVFNSADSASGISKSYPELQYVKVLAVTTASGIDVSGESYTKDSELPATVTMLVNQKQAELLTAIDKTGNPVFSLIYPSNGDTAIANKFLEKQDAYFKNGSF